MKDIKPNPNRHIREEIWRNMSIESRIKEVCRLSDSVWELHRHGLKLRFPELDDKALDKLLMERKIACHNINY
jgi:hypothetical protein